MNCAELAGMFQPRFEIHVTAELAGMFQSRFEIHVTAELAGMFQSRFESTCLQQSWYVSARGHHRGVCQKRRETTASDSPRLVGAERNHVCAP